jgi:pyruvate,water dikinase
VVRAYQRLAERCGSDAPAVAVRSSAVEEDGAVASFAGQYATYLNVAGAGDVVQAVLRCWASAHAPGMLSYRRHQGLAGERARLAVLIQQLILADVSAVLFSAHPATRDRDQIVINASWGLGASVVGGTVTPDTYVVRKADLTILVRQVADKRRMTVAVPDGTREVGVPRLLRTRPALDDGQIVALARLALALEQRMGWPVDVECAYQQTDLYLLQCRPITALSRPGVPSA